MISKKGVITRLPPIASSADMTPAQPPQQPASRMKQSILAAIQASNIRPAEGTPSATPDGLAEVGAHGDAARMHAFTCARHMYTKHRQKRTLVSPFPIRRVRSA